MRGNHQQRLSGACCLVTTIAVTGAQGQLGSELCRQIGADAVPLDLPTFDLTDRRGVLRHLESLHPGVIVNTAAYTQVDRAESEVERCRAVNVAGVAHLVEACRRLNSTLVQVSTDYVFGADAARATPYREDDPPGPLAIYAQTKLEGERYARAVPRHFIVRSCGLYGRLGPRAAGNFVETMLRLGRERGRLRVVADQTCTPTYVAHLARAIRFLLSTRAFGTYHVVNQGQTTWYDFAAEIFGIAEIPVELEPITSADWKAPARRPAYSVLDSSKYEALPGRPAMPPWQEALAEYLAARGSAAT